MLNRCLYLIAYDVRVPNRLVAALHLTRRYATGGQKSVHECWLTEDFDRRDDFRRGALAKGDEGC